MKKIIYSLVIMIAAGSLFTSCIEQVEPVGLLDMRTAKAEYIRALKDLRAADAEYVRAKAAVEQANARYVDAQTAYQNAVTENQNLLNELQALYNEAQEMENELRAAEIAAEIAELEMQIEKSLAEHAIEMVKAQAELAMANESLRVILRDIAIASKSLSPNEKLAVAEASALVAVLTKAQYDVIVDLAQAEAELDTLVLHAIDANFVWDEGLLEDAEKHYEHQIEEAQANIAQYKALREAIPDTLATLEEWKAVLDNYDKAIEVIEEQMAKNTYDSSAFFKVIVGSGIQSFNEAIAAFIEENWEQKEGEAEKDYWYEPTLTAAEKAWVKNGAPAKTDKDAEGKEKYYYYTNFPADSLTFKPLTTVKGIVNFNKFSYMLTNVQDEDYTYNQENKFWKSNKDHKPFMGVVRAKQTPDPDTLFIYGKINKEMQDFILGKAGNGIGSQTFGEGADKVTASYGLWGAYDIMERVYKEAKEKYDKEKIDSLVDTTAKIWTIQHDILAAGLAAYKPYTDAIAAMTTAKTNYDNAKTADAQLAKDLVDAAIRLRDIMKSVVGNEVIEHAPAAAGEYFNVEDTTLVLAAIKGFAEKRDAYLVQTAAGKAKHDSTKFYFWKSYDAYTEKAVVDSSTLFSALDESLLRTAKYDYWWESAADTKENAIFFKREQWAQYDGGWSNVYINRYNNGIANIANQLLGENFAHWFQGGYYFTETGAAVKIAHPTWDPDVRTQNNHYCSLIQDTTYFGAAINASALMNTYAIDLTAKTVKYKDGSDYQGADLKAKEKAYEDAMDDVLDAVAAFVGVYNEYWGQSATVSGAVTTAYTNYMTGVAGATRAAAENAVAGLFVDPKLMDKGKLPTDSYTIEDFKPYGNETPLVTFGINPTSGEIVPETASIDTTNAFLAVLTEVDPACEAKQNNHFFGGEDEDVPNINKSYVMYGGNTESPKQTTLFKALYWQYVKYIASSEIVPEDLKAIKTWIEEEVQKVFVDNAGKQPEKHFDTQLWQDDSTDYVKAAARNVVVNAYLAKKKEFVGTRTEVIGGKDSVVMNDLYVKYIVKEGVAEVGKPLVNGDFVIQHGKNNITDLFATNILGDYVGWSKYLGGKQLENAKKAFGEKPYEQIQEWKDEWKAANRLKNGLKEAQAKAEAVYVAKAKVEGIDGGEESIAQMIAARENYKQDLTNKISAEQDKIDTAYEKLMSLAEKNIGWDKLIAQKTAEVEAIKSQLNAINKALEQAKANLDKIMEYIKSTDAEFVIPVTLEDVDLVIETIEKALAVVGLFPDPEDPAVDPEEEMTLADAIAALLVQYGVEVNIDFQPAQD